MNQSQHGSRIFSYIIIYDKTGDNKNQKQDIKVRYCGDRQPPRPRIKKKSKFWCTVLKELEKKRIENVSMSFQVPKVLGTELVETEYTFRDKNQICLLVEQ